MRTRYYYSAKPRAFVHSTDYSSYDTTTADDRRSNYDYLSSSSRSSSREGSDVGATEIDKRNACYL